MFARCAPLALVLAAASCATLTACRLEFAVDAGTFAPSVGQVNTLLEQDRVRAALERAEVLTRRYRGPEAELAHGWALWRNGDLRGAEARFRRAAEAGSDEGHAGLAAVLASGGHLQEALASARLALVSGERMPAANAVLAGVAWAAGDADMAAGQLRAWSDASAGTTRGRAAAAMAAAVARIAGPPHAWRGEPVVIGLQEAPDGQPAIEVEVAGQTALLRLDLTFRQSIISRRAVERLGLPVDGTAATGTARGPSPRWPGLLSPRQVMVPELDFGGLSLRNIVCAVAEMPDGVDGVLGADVLAGARWSLSMGARQLLLAAPDVEDRMLPTVTEGPAVAWLSARLARQGLAAQILFFPRVDRRVMAAGVDLIATSRLDSPSFVVPPGDSAAPLSLMLGGWRGDVLWRPASLTGWAIDGGVAPRAVLGSNIFEAWALHWYPRSLQLRIDHPRQPVGSP